MTIVNEIFWWTRAMSWTFFLIMILLWLGGNKK